MLILWLNPISRLERITDATGQKTLQTGSVRVLVYIATNTVLSWHRNKWQSRLTWIHEGEVSKKNEGLEFLALRVPF